MSTYWQQFRGRQKAIEKRFLPEVYREVRAHNKSFLAAAKAHGFSYARNNIDKIVKPDGIATVLKRLYHRAAYVEANYQLSSLMKRHGRKSEVKRNSPLGSFGVGFDQLASVIDNYFKIRMLNKSAIPITETSKRYIRDKLIEAVDAGVPYEDAVTNFRELALVGDINQKPMSKNRARMIIQTESARAMSFGGLIGAYMSGVDLDKVWITCDDEKVRGASRPAKYPHTRLDRQVTTLFGSFQNGESIKMPGDPDASIANTAFCRCTIFYKQKDSPKPRDRGRKLANFLTEFMVGLLQGALLGELITQDEE